MSRLGVNKVTFPGSFRSQETKGRVMSQEGTLRGAAWLLLKQPGFTFLCHRAAQSLCVREWERKTKVSLVW